MYYGRITYLRVNGQVLIDKEKNQSEAENRITPDWWIYQTSDGTYIVTWYHRAVLKADLGLKTLDSKGGDIMGRYKDLTRDIYGDILYMKGKRGGNEK